LQNVVYVSQWNDPCGHMRQNDAYIMAYTVYQSDRKQHILVYKKTL